MDLKALVLPGMHWIHLAGNRSQRQVPVKSVMSFYPLNRELNPICHLLALLGAHPILRISRIRVKYQKKTWGISQ